MVLRGRLSNPKFEDLLQSLISQKRRKGPAKRSKPRAGSPDGRRSFGSVSGAILKVLAETDGELRLRDIHAGVERELEGKVSLYSVADYLAKRSRPPKPLFVRTRYGHYRLLRR